MKTAVIVLHGFAPIDTPTSIKTVEYTEERQLISELKRLQKGYCEKGDPRPRIDRHEKVINGKKRRVIECSALHTDWHYTAQIGFKIKPEANKPYEILS